MIDNNLRKKLVDLATAAGARIYTGAAPEGASFPLVVLRRTGGQTPRTLGGIALFSRCNVTADVVATTYGEAHTLATAIRDALHGFVGVMPKATTSATDTTVRSCRCTAEPTDDSTTDGDRVLRVISQEFAFVYQ